MNGAMNRKLLFVLGPVTGLVMFAGVVMIVSQLVSREYREPYRAPAATVDTTPRVKTVKVSEPPVRSAGVKVADVDELVAKLKAMGVHS